MRTTPSTDPPFWIAALVFTAALSLVAAIVLTLDAASEDDEATSFDEVATRTVGNTARHGYEGRRRHSADLARAFLERSLRAMASTSNR